MSRWSQPFVPGGPTLRQVAISVYGPGLAWSLGHGAITPLLPLRAMQLGADAGTAAAIMAIFPIGALLAALPAGWLTVRTGERFALVGAAVVAAVGVLLAVSASSVAVLGAAVLVLGMAQAVFALARQSYLTTAIPPHQRARALSTLGGVFRIGVFAGPFLGAGMIALGGRLAPFWLDLVLLVVAAGCAWVLPDLPTDGVASSTGSVRNRVRLVDVVRDHWHVLLSLGLGIGLCTAARQARNVVIPLWGDHIGLDAATVSLVFGLSGLMDVLVFYPAGVLMDRYSRWVVAVPAMTLLGLGLILLPVTGSAPAMVLVGLLIGLGNGLGSGIVMTLSGDAAPIEGRTSFLSAARFLADAGGALGPVVVSVVTALAGLGMAAAASGALAWGAGAAFARWAPRGRPGRDAA